jgi:hypothetical protein
MEPATMTGNHQQTAEALSADLYAGAKLILLTEDGTLADRLTRAYTDMAAHAAPLAAQLPGGLGLRVLTLHETFTGGAEPTNAVERAAVRTFVDALPRDELTRAALDIAELADDLDLEVRSAHGLGHFVP